MTILTTTSASQLSVAPQLGTAVSRQPLVTRMIGSRIWLRLTWKDLKNEGKRPLDSLLIKSFLVFSLLSLLLTLRSTNPRSSFPSYPLNSREEDYPVGGLTLLRASPVDTHVALEWTRVASNEIERQQRAKTLAETLAKTLAKVELTFLSKRQGLFYPAVTVQAFIR